MDELACFAPGMIALGSSGYGPDESQKFLSLAEEVSSIIENSYMRTSVLCTSVCSLVWALFLPNKQNDILLKPIFTDAENMPKTDIPDIACLPFLAGWFN